MEEKKLNRKVITFFESEGKMIEMLTISGWSPKQIAEDVFGVVEATFIWNMNREQNKKTRDLFDKAKARVIADATQSLKKISDGYSYLEKEYKQKLKPIAKEYFESHRIEFSELALKGSFDHFMSFVIEGMLGELEGNVKITEKYEKPDARAVFRILEAHQPEVWDLDGKRKQIPQLHIVAKVENEPQRQKKIVANYTVEA